MGHFNLREGVCGARGALRPEALRCRVLCCPDLLRRRGHLCTQLQNVIVVAAVAALLLDVVVCHTRHGKGQAGATERTLMASDGACDRDLVGKADTPPPKNSAFSLRVEDL